MKNCPHFGQLIRLERERKNIPLWKLAATIPFPQSNVNRIELGQTEPRIGLAMRILYALGVQAGDFMQNLAIQIKLLPDKAMDGRRPEIPFFELENEILCRVAATPAAIFGALLKQARIANKKTQLQVAETAGYTTRSLILVEQGKQEPGLVSAMKLVVATDASVNNFFDLYCRSVVEGLHNS